MSLCDGPLQRSQRALSPTDKVQAQAEAAAVKVGDMFLICKCGIDISISI